jgi:hypothetical protein
MCWRRGQSVRMSLPVAEGEQCWAKGRRRWREVIVSAPVTETFSRECVASLDELGEVVDSIGIGEAG